MESIVTKKKKNTSIYLLLKIDIETKNTQRTRYKIQIRYCKVWALVYLCEVQTGMKLVYPKYRTLNILFLFKCTST